MFEELSIVDIMGVFVMLWMSDYMNMLCEDVVVKSDEVFWEVLLKNVLEMVNGLIKVLVIIDESGDGE